MRKRSGTYLSVSGFSILSFNCIIANMYIYCVKVLGLIDIIYCDGLGVMHCMLLWYTIYSQRLCSIPVNRVICAVFVS